MTKDIEIPSVRIKMNLNDNIDYEGSESRTYKISDVEIAALRQETSMQDARKN